MGSAMKETEDDDYCLYAQNVAWAWTRRSLLDGPTRRRCSELGLLFGAFFPFISATQHQSLVARHCNSSLSSSAKEKYCRDSYVGKPQMRQIGVVKTYNKCMKKHKWTWRPNSYCKSVY